MFVAFAASAAVIVVIVVDLLVGNKRMKESNSSVSLGSKCTKAIAQTHLVVNINN